MFGKSCPLTSPVYTLQMIMIIAWRPAETFLTSWRTLPCGPCPAGGVFVGSDFLFAPRSPASTLEARLNLMSRYPHSHKG